MDSTGGSSVVKLAFTGDRELIRKPGADSIHPPLVGAREDDERVLEVLWMYESGRSYSEIAAATGMSRSAAAGMIKRIKDEGGFDGTANERH